MRAQQREERRVPEALVADLQRVPERPVGVRDRLGPPVEPRVVLTGELCRRAGAARQQVQERVDPRGVEAQARRELPEQRAQLGTEREDARGEEVGQRHADVAQLLEVGDVAAALDGEQEVVGGLRGPRAVGPGPLQRVERPVDLDRVHQAGEVRELAALRQAGRVEHAAPRRVAPARRADPDPTRRGRTGYCTRHRDKIPPSATMWHVSERANSPLEQHRAPTRTWPTSDSEEGS